MVLNPNSEHHDLYKKGEHPELDDSEYLDSNRAKKQSTIGVIQWDVSLGRLDFKTIVMTLEYFKAEPR